jgi:hypothetical protein
MGRGARPEVKKAPPPRKPAAGRFNVASGLRPFSRSLAVARRLRAAIPPAGLEAPWSGLALARFWPALRSSLDKTSSRIVFGGRAPETPGRVPTKPAARVAWLADSRPPPPIPGNGERAGPAKSVDSLHSACHNVAKSPAAAGPRARLRAAARFPPSAAAPAWTGKTEIKIKGLRSMEN